jgi:UDP-N-acetylglucosamine 2-epimerase (non-hydrolysing)
MSTKSSHLEHMKNVTIAVVFGTRPEAIKLAPVIRQLTNVPQLNVEVINSGQHSDLLDGLLDDLSINPTKHLTLFREGQSLGQLTSKAILEFDSHFEDIVPRIVIVQGDTTTAFSAALAAFLRGIPVAHVEAGLRTGDIWSPFPEEGNRQLISRISQLHFAPTELAASNLISEGIDQQKVVVAGNTIVDSVEWFLRLVAEEGSSLDNQLARVLEIKDRKFFDSPFCMITLHRRENTGSAFSSILRAIRDYAVTNPGFSFVFPVHPNPNISIPAREILSGLPNVRLLKPLSYVPFLAVMSKAKFVLSDSGGVQEEAVSMRIPVLVARENTERTEGFVSGKLHLIGTAYTEVLSSIKAYAEDESVSLRNSSHHNPFGDGNASFRIVQVLLKELSDSKSLG